MSGEITIKSGGSVTRLIRNDGFKLKTRRTTGAKAEMRENG